MLDAIEPDPVAMLHPIDLARLGVKPGDVVTIESRRGSVSLYARDDEGSPPGAVFVPFCYYEAAINKLTNPALDPFGKIPEFKYCAVRISFGRLRAHGVDVELPGWPNSGRGDGRLTSRDELAPALASFAAPEGRVSGFGRPGAADMRARGVHLGIQLPSDDQHGADVHNPLFELLSAVREHGSIQHAAKAIGASYRHVWGALKHWEGSCSASRWSAGSQGQPARLTPFAQRMVWAEARAAPPGAAHRGACVSNSERVLSDALDGTQQVFTLYASHDLALPLAARARGRRASAARGTQVRRQRRRAARTGRRALRGGRVPRAQVTGREQAVRKSLKPLLKPGLHKLIGCATRRQGLIVARGNPARPGVAARPGA